MPESRSLFSIETELNGYKAHIARLCGEGARVLADEKASGSEVLEWLVTEGGMKDKDARNLCVEIIRERRVPRDTNA